MCVKVQRVSVCITGNGMLDPFLVFVATSDPIEKKDKRVQENSKESSSCFNRTTKHGADTQVHASNNTCNMQAYTQHMYSYIRNACTNALKRN